MIDTRILAATAAEMREIDRRAIEEHGIAGEALMDRAGTGAVDVVLGRFPRPTLRRGVVLVAGRGNNGGDAFVMARRLHAKRIPVEVFLLGASNDVAGDAAHHLGRMLAAGIELRELDDRGLPAFDEALGRAGLVVDALFGTGLTRDLEGHAAEVVARIQSFDGPVVAVDIPSGVDADRGGICGVAVEALLTVTFALPKVGLLVEPGRSYAGEIVIVDIGVPPRAIEAVDPRQVWVLPEAIAAGLPERAADGHKGTFGHVLVIAGASGKLGAAALAGRGALRAGAGLVTVASPAAELGMLVIGQPELMTEPLAGPDGRFAWTTAVGERLTAVLENKRSVVLGPGLGTSEAARELVEHVLANADGTVVLDADGLNVLGERHAMLRDRSQPTILTPHPGEASRLLGRSTESIQADRPAAVRELAERTGAVVVLKGAATLTATPDGRISINASGNPGMATGGMGDVLGGVIASLVAQGLEPWEAAELGVAWHGAAGDRIAVQRAPEGMLASELADELPDALRDFRDRLQEALEPAAGDRNDRTGA